MKLQYTLQLSPPVVVIGDALLRRRLLLLLLPLLLPPAELECARGCEKSLTSAFTEQ